jgi:acyl-CoA thioester hydrolase
MSFELDSFGHVNNANYLNYLEKARNDFMLQKGLDFDCFRRWNAFPVVKRAELDFLVPLRADQEILVRGEIVSHTAASFLMEYEIILRDSEQTVLKARTEHVFVGGNGRPCRLPGEFCRAFGLENKSARH